MFISFKNENITTQRQKTREAESMKGIRSIQDLHWFLPRKTLNVHARSKADNG